VRGSRSERGQAGFLEDMAESEFENAGDESEVRIGKTPGSDQPIAPRKRTAQGNGGSDAAAPSRLLLSKGVFCAFEA
jgi:hypothetical protein